MDRYSLEPVLSVIGWPFVVRDHLMFTMDSPLHKHGNYLFGGGEKLVFDNENWIRMRLNLVFHHVISISIIKQ